MGGATKKSHSKPTDALQDPVTQRLFAESCLRTVHTFRASAPTIDELWQRGEIAALDAADVAATKAVMAKGLSRRAAVVPARRVAVEP